MTISPSQENINYQNRSLTGISGKLFRFLLKILPLRKYPMTILLVAKKRVRK